MKQFFRKWILPPIVGVLTILGLPFIILYMLFYDMPNDLIKGIELDLEKRKVQKEFKKRQQRMGQT